MKIIIILKKNRFNNGDAIKRVTDPKVDPVEWEKANEAGADPRALTLSQIIAYQEQITK